MQNSQSYRSNVQVSRARPLFTQGVSIRDYKRPRDSHYGGGIGGIYGGIMPLGGVSIMMCHRDN